MCPWQLSSRIWVSEQWMERLRMKEKTGKAFYGPEAQGADS